MRISTVPAQCRGNSGIARNGLCRTARGLAGITIGIRQGPNDCNKGLGEYGNEEIQGL